MGVATMIALATHVQVEVPMNRRTVVMVLVAVQLESKSSTHRQATHHQQSNTHEEFSPCRHRFDVNDIFKDDRREG